MQGSVDTGEVLKLQEEPERRDISRDVFRLEIKRGDGWLRQSHWVQRGLEISTGGPGTYRVNRNTGSNVGFGARFTEQVHVPDKSRAVFSFEGLVRYTTEPA